MRRNTNATFPKYRNTFTFIRLFAALISCALFAQPTHAATPGNQSQQITLHPSQQIGTLLPCLRAFATNKDLSHIPTQELREDLHAVEQDIDRQVLRLRRHGLSMGGPITLFSIGAVAGLGGLGLMITGFVLHQVPDVLLLGVILGPVAIVGAVFTLIIGYIWFKWIRKKRRKNSDYKKYYRLQAARQAIKRELGRRPYRRSLLPPVHGHSLAIAF